MSGSSPKDDGADIELGSTPETMTSPLSFSSIRSAPPSVSQDVLGPGRVRRRGTSSAPPFAAGMVLPLEEDRSTILDINIKLCTRNIVGLLALEVWKYNPHGGNLVTLKTMKILRKPQEVDPDGTNASGEAAEAYEYLLKQGIQKRSVGVGLPGVLWKEAPPWAAGPLHRVKWWKIRDIACDPYQAHDELLRAKIKAGFTLAAGVRFNIRNFRGLVIYYANAHINPRKLRSEANSRIIFAAASVIGAAAAAEKPFEEAASHKQDVRAQNWKDVRVAFSSFASEGGNSLVQSLGNLNQTKSEVPAEALTGIEDEENGRVKYYPPFYRVRLKAKRWAKKIGGGAGSPPPPMDWHQSGFTFVGALASLSVVAQVNAAIRSSATPDLSLLMPPLAAFCGLQYALTAAGPAQPRNAVLSNLFGMSTTVALSYVPMPRPMPHWFRPVLNSSVVIAGMAKLGIPHPPAVAFVYIYSDPKTYEVMDILKSWGVAIGAYFLMIVMAVVFNNWSDDRQYPTSWPNLMSIISRKDSLVRGLLAIRKHVSMGFTGDAQRGGNR